VRLHGGVDPVPLATVSVIVRVRDLNDNPPQFHDVSPRVVHVGNDIPSSSSVAQMLATDADSGSNGDVTYLLAPGNRLRYQLTNRVIYFSTSKGQRSCSDMLKVW